MAREGLMDDVGYHGFDNAEMLAEKYCHRCKHQPIETDADGKVWAKDCNKDCSLADPRYFEEDTCMGTCANCGNKECPWYDNFLDKEQKND